jgi:hypothetical protein
MKPSTQVAAVWQRTKKTGQVLVLISVLTLLMPITGVMDFLPSTSAPFAGQIATTNGDLHIGG